VPEFVNLLFDGRYHFRMPVAHVQNSNAGHEVDVATAVHIPHFRSLCMAYYQRVLSRIRGGQHLFIPFDNGSPLGANSS